MAKLNVTVPAVDVTIDGATYRKVDRSAQEGDVVRITDEEDEAPSYVHSGSFYEVVRLDDAGDVQIIDEDGDEYDLGASDITFEVYEKVEQEAAQPKRLTVGDYARVVGVNRNGHNYDNGSVIKIVKDDRDRSPYSGEKADGSVGNWLREENVEPATEAEFLAQKDIVIHDGKQYRKVARKAGVGDPVVITKSESFGRKVGAVLKATKMGSWAAIADDGSSLFTPRYDGYDGNEDYLVLVPLDSAPKYREVKRKATVGERIKVVAAWWANGKYDNGDELTVDRVDSDGDIHVTTAKGDAFIALKEYVVLEPVDAAKPTETFKVGDRAILATKVGGYLAGFTVGDTVKIVENPYDPDPEHYRVENAEGTRGYAAKNGGLKAIEPMKPERLKVGDYVQVTKPGGSHNYKIGEFVQITEMYGRGIDAFKGLRSSNATIGNWLFPKQVIPATEAQFTMSTPKPTFNVGDTVKLTVADGKTPRFNWGSVKNGDVGTVRYVRPDKVVVNFPSQSSWNADPTELTKVSAGEAQPKPDPRSQFAKGDKVRLIAKADRLNGYAVGKIYEVKDPFSGTDRVQITGGGQQHGYPKAHELEKVTEADVKAAAEEAKWTAIGRKVGEYKNGDLVRFTEDTGAGGYPEGTIAEIRDLYEEDFRFGENGKYMGDTSWIELVTPVEARFDR